MIWLGGFVLAMALYLVGPDRFIDACWNLFETIDATLRQLADELGARTYGVVRAFAIAIYVVFVLLCLLAAQRGRGGFWSLIFVTVVFAMLTWHPFGLYPAPLSRWIAGLALVVIAALMMTRRLAVEAVPRTSTLPPYPPGRMP
jgi:hypothetical protein